MKAIQVAGIVGAIAFAVMIHQFGGNTPHVTAPDVTPEAAVNAGTPAAPTLSAVVPQAAAAFAPALAEEPRSMPLATSEPVMPRAETADDSSGMKLAALSPHDAVVPPTRDSSGDASRPDEARRDEAKSDEAKSDEAKANEAKSDDAPKSAPVPQDFQYLIYYVWSELPPAEKPAAIVLRSFKDIPVGTPLEEIKRASDAFGLDFHFMKAVAKIESGFDPKQRTGSYIGLFQLSEYEFGKFGAGQIRSPRDNAVAAAYKIITEGILFEWVSHRKPTLSDLYLIHQQGWEGAGEHISQPDRIAWKSMCATSEGRAKGEKWCRRAIWGNTLPAVKRAWKSVDKLKSEAFVGMWRARVAEFYSKSIATAAAEPAKP